MHDFCSGDAFVSASGRIGNRSHGVDIRMPSVQRFAALCAVAAICAGCSRELPAAPPATSASPADAPPTKRVVGPLSEADAQALATMNDRLKDYVALHDKLEKSLAEAADGGHAAADRQATSAQLEKLMRSARANAKPGDIFTADAQPVIQPSAGHGVRRARRQAAEGVDHGRERGRIPCSSKSGSTRDTRIACR